ncbi:hypothetical protein HJC23_006790 [Cyclotella cryptica]|uniref:Uncharacterized protein n=1 Tax=Cyclotella cryptica TaxID=29204 RepID=A0ABD3PJJ1_9STRA|eukprot:CCRYP_015119-RA/>CCRYP_015119-RA protein AED:0.13 eAED:0.13 QI:0/-1/0/1/-1/1/1/0/509
MSHPLYAAPKKSRQPVDVPHTCYQIDFAAINCGKMVAASKRRIRFKFGYTNVDAISNGGTGQDCRGSEHDVTITWSLSSGKQAVVFDGKEVYFDVGDTTKVKCSFKDNHGHTIEVSAHAAPMSTKSVPDPDWKQYDLLIDGISYFRYPKIYQLGVFSQDQPEFSPAFVRQNEPTREIRRETASDTRRMEGDSYRNMEPVLPKEEKKPEPVEVADLLSFDDSEIVVSPVQSNNYAVPSPLPTSAAPAPTLMDYSSTQYTQNFASAPNGSFNVSTNPFGNTDFGQQQMSPGNTQYAQQMSPVTPNEMTYSNYQSGQSNQYSSYHTSTNPFDHQANPNPPSMVENNAYNQVMPANSHNNGMPAQPQMTAPAPHTYAPAPITPNCSSSALVPVTEASAPTYTASGAVQSLVNIDDIFGPSAVTAAKKTVNAPTQPAGQKKPVMNNFNPTPMAYQQQPQQGMYQQQPQQGMYNGFAPQYQQQQPQAQQPYNNYAFQQNYPQQGYAQSGYQQPSY